ncbi:alpha/beta fold hydrolase [Georgenia deserti]|uniref:Alpha/beta fold hydrolase n=1 Tax=Georgenia deserti TaxID=2093781 RepID=A0ABW4L1U3_9MICO
MATPAPRLPAGPGPEPQLVEERSVVVAGARTRYHVWGDPTAETTILAVHGFRGDHHGLLPIAAHLPDHRVVTPDLPGFGASAPFPTDGPDAGPHDVTRYARWLAELWDVAGTGRRRVLLGHSFGSVVAAAALAHEVFPDNLVLVNPIAAPALHGPRAMLSAAAVGYYRLGAALPERIGGALLASRGVVRVISELMTTTEDRELRRWIHDQHRRYFSGYHDRRVVVEAFTASVSHHVGDYAAHLTAPTLLIAGDKDDIAAPAAQYRLAEQVGAQLEMLTGVGHLIHYERPAAAAAAIRRFLDQLAAA